MVIDTSALVAIILGEPESDGFLTAMREAGEVLICTATVLECRMVIYGRLGHRGVVMLDDLLDTGIFVKIAADDQIVETAFNAFIAFGKGSGHPASLNFGDVFAYAAAKTRNLPLLFKGEDFSKTDIRAAASRKYQPSGL